ncbi:helix-turn-helix domain-containing protein [Leucobacter sp. UT-8R-CII-1-4]|uniref:helix-turn-helix domain-containing protein n=1 Tax=Leucobacter sp. UT-8R-CII-1-4 TaxID=3040075 RepID=UPI0024A9A9FB|nr:helix-turn-helix domain-containing protein [Leucobacter sp. UT-8R-CII-1-4]MDI6022063.1 helix-turn-helix domain-containing protein [Leucobacter sp. UT-8R-CII-1-4]
MSDQERGVLYPSQLPEFHRYLPDEGSAYAVRWFWLPEWNLAPGTSSRQEVLPFPASNFTVEGESVTLVGPPTQRSYRLLEGRGWCVGALLRPAAAYAIAQQHAGDTGLSGLRDQSLSLVIPELAPAVSAIMSNEDRPAEERRALAVRELSDFLLGTVEPPAPGSEAALANHLEQVLGDPALIRTDQLPDRLPASLRTLQRVAERYFGVPLHAMIRRRRLQESAARLRTEAGLNLAALATELGYADHAHFSKDFRAFLGKTPSEYRAQSFAS